MTSEFVVNRPSPTSITTLIISNFIKVLPCLSALFFHFLQSGQVSSSTMAFRLQLALLSVVFFSLNCLQSVSANPVRPRTDYAVKDFHPAPRAWSNIGSPSGDHMISLSLGLTQSRFEELERHLYEGVLYRPSNKTTNLS